MAQSARTNRLVHRICQDYENDLSYLNIPTHEFMAACKFLLKGRYTPAQVANFWSFSAGELADWNTLSARVTAYSNTINTNGRDRAVMDIEAILMLYERSYEHPITGFTTPDGIWARLMEV